MRTLSSYDRHMIATSGRQEFQCMDEVFVMGRVGARGVLCRPHVPNFSPYGFLVRTDIQRLVVYFPNDMAGSSGGRARRGTSEGLAPRSAVVNQSTL